jgi:homoserine kinase
MPVRAAIAFAPATVANVGPGFDVFGFAIDGPGDVVELRRTPRPGVRIAWILGDGGRLPRAASRNVASAVVLKMLRAAAVPFGADLVLRKGLPLGSGMGSSSASAVAAALAANALLDGRFSDRDLLGFARHGERVACGAAHADNVAPCLFGGFTLVRGEPPEVDRIAVPPRWHVAVVHPGIELPTRRARAAVPEKVSVAAMTANVGAAAALIAAMHRRDIASAGRALMADAVVEPARAGLIPGYAAVRRAALAAGAAGASISGAGPSMFALTDGRAGAKMAAAAMAAAWKREGVDAELFVGRMGAPGARLIQEGR